MYQIFVTRAFEKFMIEKCQDGAFIRYATVHFNTEMSEHCIFVDKSEHAEEE